MEDEGALPHSIDVKHMKHFKGVEIPTLSGRKSIDILIGQNDKLLLAVLEEREGSNSEEPNYVLTRLGPIASGGCVHAGSKSLSNLKVQTNQNCKDCELLKRENIALKEAARANEIENETLQPSENDEIARKLVETNVKVVNDRYEIPVPLKNDVAEKLPNNYSNALKRTLSVRRKALNDVQLKNMLTETFEEMISEGWIETVDERLVHDNGCWYLPFFVTSQEKSRVVFDGAASFKGASLNDAVLPGSNLLNNLVDVLIRFRLGKFACMADLSKCFFQVAMPENQQKLFRLIWFADNDIEKAAVQIFKFTRHVWGINSSPFVALFAIETLINENPTNASL